MASQRPKSLAQIMGNLRTSMEDDSSGSKVAIKGGKTEFGSISMSDVPYGNLQELYTELLTRFRAAQAEKEELSATVERRQEAYMRKEMQYKNNLEELETRMQTVKVEDTEDSHMGHIRGLHIDIQEAIQKVQGKTSDILKTQERDLIQAFHTKLADVTDELEKERKKNESGSVEWVQRCRKLTEELEWFRDLTEKLTSENKSYLKENRRFKRQLKTQEEDREFLIKQLVTVKKENSRLRRTYEQLTNKQSEAGSRPNSGRNRAATPINPSPYEKLDFDTPTTPQSQSRRSRMSPGPSTPTNNNDQTTLFKNKIAKLKKQYEVEANKTRTMRTAYTQEVAQRTELQNFLKKCIEDVRTDLSTRSKNKNGLVKPAKRPMLDPRDLSPEQFSPSDRITVMEWLISQDQVIYLLYDRMFPRAGTKGGQGTQLDPGFDYGSFGGDSSIAEGLF